MGELLRPGSGSGTLVSVDDGEGADVDAPATQRERFAVGSEQHDLDALLAAYLLDLDVSVPRTTQRGARVLLVEADPNTGRLLAEMLEVAGHAVLIAESTIAAVELLQGHEFDLVIADAMTAPVPTALRDAARDLDPRLPVIVMSDDPVVAATWARRDHAMAGFVEKPVRGLLLLAAIAEALRYRDP